jgi:hypothetical protein
LICRLDRSGRIVELARIIIIIIIIINTTHEDKIWRGFKEEMEKQSNGWVVHKKYG